MRVEVPDRRSSIEQLPEGLRYRIPLKRSIPLLIFLPFWMVGWGTGEVFGLRSLLNDDGFPSLFLGFWLLAWTFGGCMAVYTWLASLLGAEIVTIGSGSLTIKRDVTGFERTREYGLQYVQNLRVSPDSGDFFRRTRGGPFDAGRIAFDYGAKTYRFAAGVDEAEAAVIVAELKRRM